MGKNEEKNVKISDEVTNGAFFTIFILLKISTIEEDFGEFWKISDKMKKGEWTGGYSLTMTAPRALRRCTMS